jgi:hypothetical protein
MQPYHVGQLKRSQQQVTRAGSQREGAHPSTQPESFLSYVDAAKQGRCLRQYILTVLDGSGESCIVSGSAPCSNCAPLQHRSPDRSYGGHFSLGTSPARSERSEPNVQSFMSSSGGECTSLRDHGFPHS